MSTTSEKPDAILEAITGFAPSLERLLTAAQVADLLHLNVRTLARWRLNGEGPVFLRLGPRQVRYSAAAVADFAERSIRRPGF